MSTNQEIILGNKKFNVVKLFYLYMTTCRLMKQKVYKDKMACIYIGAQKTYESLELWVYRYSCGLS
jgi:hypothetical protein